MRRHLLTRAATVVAASAAIASVVIPGTASPESADRSGDAADTPAASAPISPLAGKKYVALGSSYASGPDASPLADRQCFRTLNDYPHQVAAATGMYLTDVTCSGATTANILGEPQRRIVGAPQIDAVSPDTAVVTITTGGNDLDYVGRLTAASCTNAVGPAAALRQCLRGRAVPIAPTAADYSIVEDSIAELVTTVRTRAPHARILLVDYPPVLASVADTCPRAPMTAEQAKTTVETFGGLAQATAMAAAITGAELVAASKVGAAHTVCSREPWLHGLERPVPYHPNTLGRSAVAKLVVDALH